MTDALIERLEREAKEMAIVASRRRDPVERERDKSTSKLLAEAAQDLKAKDAEIAELRGALKLLNREIGSWEWEGPNGETAVFEYIDAILDRKALGGSDGS